ncbi:hypothetical protein QBC47DRAFT_407424 [Echria macrotheca]|uniref:NB-ARC domain-containing protein n=1 Tax=Echria macrotheca TaxID=438768 RepID=A0AAJ0F4C1_9PEZI|nr:hypothetical protein QBC47DRAFT_407424 [Echria macrotheca]
MSPGLRHGSVPGSLYLNPTQTNLSTTRSGSKPRGAALEILYEGPQVNAGGPAADLVFVHGLTGDRLDTFSMLLSNGTKFCWPRDLLAQDPELKHRECLRIMSFNYDADVAKLLSKVGSNTLHDHARSLLDQVQARRKSLFEALIKAHRSFEADHNQTFESTCAIFTFATPHYGSKFALPAILFARLVRPIHHFNVRILKALQNAPDTSDDWQQTLIDILLERWANRKPIYFFNAYETVGFQWLPWLGKVVPKHSAVLRGPSQLVSNTPISANHRDIVRYKTPEDEGYTIFRSKLQPILEKLPNPNNDAMAAAAAAAAARKGSGATTRKLSETSLSVIASDSVTLQATEEAPSIDLYIRDCLLPPIAKDFVGRTDLIEHINAHFKMMREAEPLITVLLGNGGHGKSQVALRFAKQAFEDRTFDLVFWVDASSESKAKACIAQICSTLDSSTSSLDLQTKVDKAIRMLDSTTQRWLIVLDNYDNFVLDREEVPPSPAGTDDDSLSIASSPVCRFDFSPYKTRNRLGCFLITSRDSKMATYATDHHVIEVGPMSEDDALDMLRNRYKSHYNGLPGWDVNAARNLVEELGCLPLAIEQAASYLICSQRTVAGFLEFFLRNKLEVLRYVPENPNIRSGRVQHGTTWITNSLSVLTVWEMSFNAVAKDIKNKEASKLAVIILQLAGFLDRNGISLWFLEEMDAFHKKGRLRALGRHHASENKTKQAIKMLKDWHLIETSQKTSKSGSGSGSWDSGPATDLFTIHPLVQDWIRYRMTESQWHDNVHHAVRVVERHLSKDHDVLLASALKDKQELVRHIDAITTELEMRKFGTLASDDLHLGVGRLAKTAIQFASFYHDMFDLDNAERLYQVVLDKHKGEQSARDPRVLEALEGLALVRLWQEKGDEAFQLCHQAREGNIAVFGRGARQTIRCTHNLGEIQCFRKEFDEAIKLFDECVVGFEKEFGSSSKEKLREMEALGNAHRAKGNTAKAYELISTAQARLIKWDSMADLTVNATESLALVRKAQGDYSEAERLYRQVIAKYEKTVGAGQYTTLGALQGLADTYRKAGRWDEAAKQYKIIMDRHRQAHGTDHAQYLRAKEAYENLISSNPVPGPIDDFSYPWPRPVNEFQSRDVY